MLSLSLPLSLSLSLSLSLYVYSVGTLTSLRAGRPAVRNPRGARHYSLLHNCPDQLWGRPSLLVSSNQNFFLGIRSHGVLSTTHLHIGPGFGVSGALPRCPLRTLRRSQAELHLHNYGAK